MPGPLFFPVNAPQRLEGLDEAGWRTLLGRKISMRFHLHGAGAPFSEAIGVVVGIVSEESGASVRVLSKRGEETKVAIDDVIAGKVFPV